MKTYILLFLFIYFNFGCSFYSNSKFLESNGRRTQDNQSENSTNSDVESQIVITTDLYIQTIEDCISAYKGKDNLPVFFEFDEDVHELVAERIIDHYSSLIDWNPNIANLSNLVWCTDEFNRTYPSYWDADHPGIHILVKPVQQRYEDVVELKVLLQGYDFIEEYWSIYCFDSSIWKRENKGIKMIKGNRHIHRGLFINQKKKN